MVKLRMAYFENIKKDFFASPLNLTTFRFTVDPKSEGFYCPGEGEGGEK